MIIKKSEGKKQIKYKSLKILISGTTSGLIGRLFVAPLERIILLKQTNELKKYTEGKNKKSFINIFRQILKQEGIKGLFKGFGMNCLRSVPLTALEFFFFDLNKNLYYKLFPNCSEYILNLFAGAIGGGMAYTVVYPIDFARTMVTVNSVPDEIPFFKILTHLKKKYGFFNMFKGLGANWIGILPYCGLKFFFFEYFISNLKKYRNSKILGKIDNLVLGGLAGSLACSLTYPLDVLRKRRQTQLLRDNTKKFDYHKLIYFIYQKQGFRGFYAGIGISILKNIPLTSLTFMMNEWCKNKFKI